MSTSFNPCRSSFSRGFTLVELLVVVAVITIITAFLLFNQNKFNSSTLLRSLAYSVGLTMRQAQTYGTSVRGFAGATTFAQGYGVYVSAANPARLAIFADLDGSGTRSADGTEDVPQGALVFARGYKISAFCAVTSAGAQDCYPSANGGATTLSALTVYFKRPNPDASFVAQCSAGACSSSYQSAYVRLRTDAASDTRAVKVTNTGQITVCALNTYPGGTPNC